MRRSFRYLVPMVAVPILAVAVILPGSASAKGPKGPKPVKVTCTTVSGNVSGVPTPPTISGCTPTSATGGMGTFSGFVGGSGNLVVTWNGGAEGTTSAAYSSTEPSPTSKGNKCAKVAAGDIEAILHGSVTGNSPAGGSPGVKAALHAKICVDTNFNLSLLPGSGPFKI
jgi:hypothetical protein